jgi:hypothetical protein
VPIALDDEARTLYLSANAKRLSKAGSGARFASASGSRPGG